MILILKGPLGIGKSTLAEALTENIDACATLSGDHLVAVNPPSKMRLNFALDNPVIGPPRHRMVERRQGDPAPARIPFRFVRGARQRRSGEGSLSRLDSSRRSSGRTNV